MLTVTCLGSFASLDLGLKSHTFFICLFAGPQKLCFFLSLFIFLISHSVLRCLTAATTATDLRFVLTGFCRLARLNLSLQRKPLFISLSACLHELHLLLHLLVLLLLDRAPLLILSLALSLLPLLFRLFRLQSFECFLLLSQPAVNRVHLSFMGAGFLLLPLPLELLLGLGLALLLPDPFPLLSLVLLASGRLPSLPLLL